MPSAQLPRARDRDRSRRSARSRPGGRADAGRPGRRSRLGLGRRSRLGRGARHDPTPRPRQGPDRHRTRVVDRCRPQSWPVDPRVRRRRPARPHARRDRGARPSDRSPASRSSKAWWGGQHIRRAARPRTPSFDVVPGTTISLLATHGRVHRRLDQRCPLATRIATGSSRSSGGASATIATDPQIEVTVSEVCSRSSPTPPSSSAREPPHARPAGRFRARRARPGRGGMR